MASHADSVGGYTKRHKVTVVGSGNWGSTVAKIVAENTEKHGGMFEANVQMWVYEEDVTIGKDSPHYDPSIGEKAQKLTSIINTYHENVKYLPGIKLPSNVIANPSLEDAAQDSSILIFNLPHQFVPKVCASLQGKIVPFARGVSCIKGVHVTDDSITLFSEWIGDSLGIYCGALSGANVANGIAAEQWSGTTIAYDPPLMDTSRNPTPRVGTKMPISAHDSPMDLTFASAAEPPHKDVKGRNSKTKLVPVPAQYWPLDHDTIRTLFERPYFEIDMVHDVAGVSLAGALKNVVALAAGFVVGYGLDSNAKARIVQKGLAEMIMFGQEFFGESVQKDTFTMTSAGVGDLITSCESGRNFRCARMAVQQGLSVDEIAIKELGGQSAQGVGTAEEVFRFLQKKGREEDYPLFTTVYRIIKGEQQAQDLFSMGNKRSHL